jgi:hypothetical protein
LYSYKNLLLTIIIAPILLVSGCAGQTRSIPLSTAQRSVVKTVSISTEVTKPKRAYYSGPTQAIGAAFGIIGALAAQADAQDVGTMLAAFMEKDKIDVGAMLTSEFAKQIAAENIFSLAGSSGGDATIKLDIKIYGLAQTQGFGTTLYPVIGVAAKMVKPDGTVIWQTYDYITPHNSQNNQGQTLSTFSAEPEKLRSSFANVAKILTVILLADLKNGRN